MKKCLVVSCSQLLKIAQKVLVYGFDARGKVVIFPAGNPLNFKRSIILNFKQA
jgi:hypothetical protein